MSQALSVMRRAPAKVAALTARRASSSVSLLTRRRSSTHEAVQQQQQRHRHRPLSHRRLSSKPAATPPSPHPSLAKASADAASVTSRPGTTAKGSEGSASVADVGTITETGALPRAPPPAGASTGAGAGAGMGQAPEAMGASPSMAKGSSNDSAVSSGADELWVVGRVLEKMDTRLGAKQEKIRMHEMGVIERYTAIVSALDGSLDPRDDDAFLAWLNSSSYSSSAQPDSSAKTAPPTTEDVAGEGKKDHPASSKVEGARLGAAKAGERQRVEKFLTSAAARLNALVSDQEDVLFRDKGGVFEEAKKSKIERKAEKEKGVEGKESGTQAIVPALPEEDLFQAKLAVHRAMLCHCLSLVSTSLEKQQLKPGLSLDEVVAAARTAYLAGPHERLGSMFPLFDKHGDGFLDAESVERAVDAAVLPVAVAAERCYAAAANPVLDKKAAKAMPATMKYALWDVLEIPIKRRCAFAWAEDRKQVGPDEWRVSWQQFQPSRRTNFPELDLVASNYLEEFRRRRSEWHNKRKGRRRAAVYGTALFFGVVFIDNMLAIV